MKNFKNSDEYVNKGNMQNSYIIVLFNVKMRGNLFIHNKNKL